MKWEYASENVAPNAWHTEVLARRGADGWEAWFLEKLPDGWREIFFKRRIEDRQ